MNILVTGATGLVGSALCRQLVLAGHDVCIVSRSSNPNTLFPYKVIQGNLAESSIPALAELNLDAVFHLMGESVSQRWTEKVKKQLRQSRIQSTLNLKKSLGDSFNQLKVFIGTSAIGFYGNAREQTLTEESPRGKGFLAELCEEWELAQKAPEVDSTKSPRIILFRLGLVLSAKGGALAKMLPAFKANLGGRIGTGEQWQSWIHIDDLIAMFMEAINSSQWEGVVNAVAPEPVKNQKFTNCLERTLGVTAVMPIPAHALELIMGEMSEILLDSQRVLPKKALEFGFQFQFKRLDLALQNLLPLASRGVTQHVSEYYFEKPMDQVEKQLAPQGFTVGAIATKLIKVGPTQWSMKTVVERVEDGKFFSEIQVAGPFQFWRRTLELTNLKSGLFVIETTQVSGILGWLSQRWGRLIGSATTGL